MAELSQDQLHQLCEALGWQGGTFWQVLETVKSLTAQATTPVAWAVFAPNGNIRMWSTNTEAIQQFARDNGVAAGVDAGQAEQEKEGRD
jgi:hypothetical protein